MRSKNLGNWDDFDGKWEIVMAPTVVRDGKFRLFFFSREEPRIHVHVSHPDGEAKFWLTPQIANSYFDRTF